MPSMKNDVRNPLKVCPNLHYPLFFRGFLSRSSPSAHRLLRNDITNCTTTQRAPTVVMHHERTASNPLSTQYLASFTSSPNPFIKSTTLEFTLNRMAYITLAIYDELGRLVWGDGRGSSLEAGTHDIQIDGSSLPGGTLYARITTGFGEVKTVKLVHEK